MPSTSIRVYSKFYPPIVVVSSVIDMLVEKLFHRHQAKHRDERDLLTGLPDLLHQLVLRPPVPGRLRAHSVTATNAICSPAFPICATRCSGSRFRGGCVLT